jgi:hypothetical protein
MGDQGGRDLVLGYCDSDLLGGPTAGLHHAAAIKQTDAAALRDHRVTCHATGPGRHWRGFMVALMRARRWTLPGPRFTLMVADESHNKAIP